MVMISIYISLVVIAGLLVWLTIKVWIPRWKEARKKAKEEHENRVEVAKELFETTIDEATDKAQKIFAEQHFIASSEWKQFREKYQPLHDAISLLKAEKTSPIQPDKYKDFEAAFQQTQNEQIRVEHNRKAKYLCKQRCSEYFDNLFKYPLLLRRNY